MKEQSSKVVRNVAKTALLVCAFLLLGFGIYYTYLSIRFRPYKVRVSNVTDSAFTVSWITDEPMVGVVYYGEKDSFLPGPLSWLGKKRAFDDRDVSDAQTECVSKFNKKVSKSRDENFTVDASGFDCNEVKVIKKGQYYTHHVTVPNLDADKEYYFRVGNGYISFKEGKTKGVEYIEREMPAISEFKQKTRETIKDISSPEPAYGTSYNVFYSSDGQVGTKKSFDSVIFLKTFKEGTEYPLMSAVTNSNGGWSIDLANVRDEDNNILAMEDTYLEFIPQVDNARPGASGTTKFEKLSFPLDLMGNNIDDLNKEVKKEESELGGLLNGLIGKSYAANCFDVNNNCAAVSVPGNICKIALGYYAKENLCRNMLSTPTEVTCWKTTCPAESVQRESCGGDYPRTSSPVCRTCYKCDGSNLLEKDSDASGNCSDGYQITRPNCGSRATKTCYSCKSDGSIGERRIDSEKDCRPIEKESRSELDCTPSTTVDCFCTSNSCNSKVEKEGSVCNASEDCYSTKVKCLDSQSGGGSSNKKSCCKVASKSSSGVSCTCEWKNSCLSDEIEGSKARCEGCFKVVKGECKDGCQSYKVVNSCLGGGGGGGSVNILTRLFSPFEDLLVNKSYAQDIPTIDDNYTVCPVGQESCESEGGESIPSAGNLEEGRCYVIDYNGDGTSSCTEVGIPSIEYCRRKDGYFPNDSTCNNWDTGNDEGWKILQDGEVCPVENNGLCKCNGLHHPYAYFQCGEVDEYGPQGIPQDEGYYFLGTCSSADGVHIDFDAKCNHKSCVCPYDGGILSCGETCNQKGRGCFTSSREGTLLGLGGEEVCYWLPGVVGRCDSRMDMYETITACRGSGFVGSRVGICYLPKVTNTLTGEVECVSGDRRDCFSSTYNTSRLKPGAYINKTACLKSTQALALTEGSRCEDMEGCSCSLSGQLHWVVPGGYCTKDTGYFIYKTSSHADKGVCMEASSVNGYTQGIHQWYPDENSCLADLESVQLQELVDKYDGVWGLDLLVDESNAWQCCVVRTKQNGVSQTTYIYHPITSYCPSNNAVFACCSEGPHSPSCQSPSSGVLDNKSMDVKGSNSLTFKTSAQDIGSSDTVLYLPESGVYEMKNNLGGTMTLVGGTNKKYAFFENRDGVSGFQPPEDPANPKDNEDRIVPKDLAVVQVDKVASTKEIDLKQGINIISFNFIPSLGDNIQMTSDNFLKLVNEESNKVSTISSFVAGQWANGTSYDFKTKETKGAPFVLSTGTGYLLLAEADTKITIPALDIKSPIPIAFSSGWNLIGVHGHNTQYTAKSLINSVNSIEGLKANNVTYWPTSKGMYQGFQLSEGQEYGQDFPISKDLGYFVRINEIKEDCRSIWWNPGGEKNGECE